MSAPTPHARGITVGLSWPRSTTPAPIVPRFEGEFRDHQDWVNFASKRLTVARDSNGTQLPSICVDTLGRRCANGRDMKRAEEEGTFPVRYFFDCEVVPDAEADLLVSLAGLVRALVDDAVSDGELPGLLVRQPVVLDASVVGALIDARAAIAKAIGSAA